MTATPTALDPQIGLEPDTDTEVSISTYHTNVYVGIEFEGEFTKQCFGPFPTADEARSWCHAHIIEGFEIHEIKRPAGVEDVAFYLTAHPPVERQTKEGISSDQTQIGDYIDPTVVP